MKKKLLKTSQAEQKTVVGKRDTVETVQYRRKSEVPKDGDHAKECLREFLGSPSYYKDSSGMWRPKKWRSDTSYIRYRKIYTMRFNLPLRFNSGLLAGIFAMVAFTVLLIVMGLSLLTYLLGSILMGAGIGASAYVIKKWEKEVISPRQKELEMAGQFHGFGLFTGFFIGGVVLLVSLFFAGMIS